MLVVRMVLNLCCDVEFIIGLEVTQRIRRVQMTPSLSFRSNSQDRLVIEKQKVLQGQ